MQKMLSEFREFAIKGNMVDMAVGIIIGAAFGTVVRSLVSDVVMPPVGMLLGGIDFSNLAIILKETAADGKGGVAIKYGAFLNNVISFLIVAFCVFLIVKSINNVKKQFEAEKQA